MDGKNILTADPARDASALNSGRRNRFWFCWLSVFLALASGALFLSYCGFSVRCHTDEPGKVRQIMLRERNFNHPLLMLNTAQAVFDASGLAPAPQNVVRVGRAVIGVFAVITVLAFAAAAEVTAGPVAALVCGLFLMTSPLMVEVAHYFKEDPAMTMGLGVAFLGIALFQKSPTAARLVLMAVGAALAASGKHLGAAVIPFCLYAIMRQPEGRAKRMAGFLAVLVGVYAAVNYQTVGQLLLYKERIGREVDLVNQGGSVPVRNLAARKYLGMLQGNFPWPLFWFVAFGAWVWAREKRRTFGLAALFAVALFLAISLVNKTAGRYFLPVDCMACYLAGAGAAWAAARRGSRWRIAAFWVPLLAAAAIGIPRGWETSRTFKNDTRLEMARWIEANLPANAVIAQDEFGQFESSPQSDSPYRIPQALFEAGADVRSVPLERLEAAGVSYVLVVNPEAATAKKKKWKRARGEPDGPGETWLERCRKIHGLPGGKFVTNVSPGVTLYRLPAQ
ncbi:MAG: ArnT family glycosyltransferase [Chthoniobacteraceae bacterium]